MAATVLAGTAAPAQAANACSVPKRFSKVISLWDKGSVRSRTAKHPGGAVRGRYMKLVDDHYTEPHHVAYGGRHTHYLTKKAVICLTLTGPRKTGLKRSTLKGLKHQAASRNSTSTDYGLIIRKKRVVKIVQLWHP
ncbi:hypothetical protein GCM10010468_52040 [Actinocorallia longicatena]|uniref:Uncharacterized protein n=2 Tax=Actinocorallia longicatena TaxID=111803 RepID=A0ABP6QIN7_9ACTN